MKTVAITDKTAIEISKIRLILMNQSPTINVKYINVVETAVSELCERLTKKKVSKKAK
jgi:hypothetical protein